MNGLLWNLLLAFSWATMTAEFTLANLAVGFGLGFLILLFARRVVGLESYARKVRQAIDLFFFFVWELIQSNLRLAHDVVTPKHYMRPAIVAVPLDARSDLEITLLANMVSLTPGTLSLDVSADRRVLFLHAMYVDNNDIEAVRRGIKEGFERRILELLR